MWLRGGFVGEQERMGRGLDLGLEAGLQVAGPNANQSLLDRRWDFTRIPLGKL